MVRPRVGTGKPNELRISAFANRRTLFARTSRTALGKPDAVLRWPISHESDLGAVADVARDWRGVFKEDHGRPPLQERAGLVQGWNSFCYDQELEFLSNAAA
jgi:hypothetical protein